MLYGDLFLGVDDSVDGFENRQIVSYQVADLIMAHVRLTLNSRITQNRCPTSCPKEHSPFALSINKNSAIKCGMIFNIYQVCFIRKHFVIWVLKL